MEYLVGAVHERVADTDWGDDLCQQGKYDRCHSLITSVAKVAACPACDNS